MSENNIDPIPDYLSLMLPVLQVAEAEEIHVGDAVKQVADNLGLSEDERALLLPSGQQTRLANRAQWAKLHLTRAGLLESTRRGYFRITDRGREVLDSNPARIDNNFLKDFEEFRQFLNGHNANNQQHKADVVTSPSEQTPDEIMRSAHEEIEAQLADELLDRIRSEPPEFFERLVVNLLLAMGYGGSVADAGRALEGSGDGGVDGVIDQDALGLDRVYIQAKRYADGNTVSSGAIRDFFGSLDRHKAAKGLFVTTSSFTASARETADFLSKRIVLIDGGRLAKLMIRYNVGCRIEETLHVKKLDEDFFD